MNLKIDDKGCIFTATMDKVTIYNPNVEIEKEAHDVQVELESFENLFDKYVKDNVLKKIDDKEDFYKEYKKEKVNVLEKEIVNTINAMVLNVIPDGETLTTENAPSLVDIINPTTKVESGTQANPVVIVDNDIAHNGCLYTYGKYYKWNDVLYHCERRGEPDGGTIKLFYTPDQLIGHYFVTV
jgi:hypothetical protein